MSRRRPGGRPGQGRPRAGIRTSCGGCSRRPIAVVCCAYLVLLIGVAVIAPIAMPSVSAQDAGNLFAANQGPSWSHLLGTDTLGRDVLSRLLVGDRVTLVGVAEALVVVLVLGVPFGLLAGYVGGWTDRVVIWLADLTFSLPAIVIIIVVLSVFPSSMLAAMITLGVLAAPGIMRVVRSATLPIREELYVEAARGLRAVADLHPDPARPAADRGRRDRPGVAAGGGRARRPDRARVPRLAGRGARAELGRDGGRRHQRAAPRTRG